MMTLISGSGLVIQVIIIVMALLWVISAPTHESWIAFLSALLSAIGNSTVFYGHISKTKLGDDESSKHRGIGAMARNLIHGTQSNARLRSLVIVLILLLTAVPVVLAICYLSSPKGWVEAFEIDIPKGTKSFYLHTRAEQGQLGDSPGRLGMYVSYTPRKDTRFDGLTIP